LFPKFASFGEAEVCCVRRGAGATISSEESVVLVVPEFCFPPLEDDGVAAFSALYHQSRIPDERAIVTATQSHLEGRVEGDDRGDSGGGGTEALSVGR